MLFASVITIAFSRFRPVSVIFPTLFTVNGGVEVRFIARVTLAGVLVVADVDDNFLSTFTPGDAADDEEGRSSSMDSGSTEVDRETVSGGITVCPSNAKRGNVSTNGVVQILGNCSNPPVSTSLQTTCLI